MELRHLRYLVAIADAGTFGRAAETLRVAQPALTRQIHDLEEELGAELFDSGARKATLTPPGDACVRLARHVIQDTEAAVRRARLSNVGVVGRCVLLAGPVPLLTGIVPRLIARVRAKYPGISLEVKELYAIEQWNMLLEGEADVGLSYPPATGFEALNWETQFVHAIDHVLVAPEHPLATKTSVTLDDLAPYEHLTLEFGGPDYEVNRNALDAAFRQRGHVPKVRMLSTFDSAIAHVRAGQGWCVMVRLMANRMAPLVGIPLEGFAAPFRTVRMWRRADKRPVIQTVLAELRLMQEEEIGAKADDQGATQPPTPPHENSPDFVSSRLELRHLRSFAQVARDGSLGLAAEGLGITQPALSRQMKDLEFDVGAPLFERGTRGVELTETGSVFLRDVESMLTVVDNIKNEVHRAGRESEQRCVLAVVPHPWVDRIVIPVIADLEARTPRIRVGTRQVQTPHQAQALRKAEVDVAIGHVMPGMDTVGFVKEELFEDAICGALLSPNHPLGGQSSLFLKDLEDVPFIFGPRSFFPQLYDELWKAFAAGGLTPRVDAEYDGLRTCWSLVASGLGWIVAWRGLKDEPPVGLRFVPILDLNLAWGAAMCYRQDESRIPVLTAIDALRDCARQLFPPGSFKAPDISPVKAPRTRAPGDTRKAAIS